MTPLVPYVSVDIETTGLNPATCQVLEIGAVIDDFITEDPNRLPKFRAIIKHDEIHGEPYALFMHGKTGLFEAIAKIPALKGAGLINPGIDDEHCMFKPEDVVPAFLNFLSTHACIDMKVGFQPAGKNFASFDKPFLEAGVPKWKTDVKIKHRTIDPGNLYWLPGIEYLPDSKLCKQRAMIGGEVAHTALEDAMDVVLEIRAYKANLERLARNLESGTQFTEAFGYLQAALHPSLVVAYEPMKMAQDIVRYIKEGLPGDN